MQRMFTDFGSYGSEHSMPFKGIYEGLSLLHCLRNNDHRSMENALNEVTNKIYEYKFFTRD